MRDPEQFKRAHLLPLSALLLLAGCGAGTVPTVSPPATTPAVGTASNLAGNWLLYGSLPRMASGSANQTGFGISFDAVGSNLVAAASINTTCNNSSIPFGLRFGAALNGSVAADGSFTIAPPQAANSFINLSVSGHAPVAAGQPWSGTYTVTNTDTLCPVNQSGSFTASPVQDINGTYTGAGSLLTSTGSTPVALSLNLKQGAPLVSPLGSTPVSSRLGITGSIQLQGFTCFTKGSSSTTVGSVVEGGPFQSAFTMDDGSTVMLLGSIDDLAASQLDINVLRVSGGSCDGIYNFAVALLVAKH